MNKRQLLPLLLCGSLVYAADTATQVQAGFDLDRVSIALLKDHPEHVDALCKMWHTVVGHKSHPNFEDVKEPYTQLLKNQMKHDELPLALIALLDGEPIGLCALRDTCIPRPGAVPWSDENPDKKPWFAIFVASAYQKCRVGTKLLQATVRHAQSTFGFDRAYAIPENKEIEQLYLRKGCVKIADTIRRGERVSVLEIAFSDMVW